MPTNVKLILDKRRIRNDKTFPIILRIIHNRKSTTIPTDYYVQEKDWNAAEKCIKLTCQQFNRTMIHDVNRTLITKLKNANDVIMKLDEKGLLDNCSVSEIKDRVLNKADKVSFETFTVKLVSEFQKMKRLGNASVYMQALKFVKKANGGKDIYFDDINYSFIKKMEVDFLGGGKSLNGLSMYLRTIRAIYNKAILEGIASEESNPFKKYRIRGEETKKRAISREDISKIEDLQLKENTPIWHARNFFLFSFYCRGINFADMAKLTMNNIIDNRIVYRRAKTRGLFSVKINDKIQSILEYYIQGKTENDFIFPILRRTHPRDQMNDFMNTRHTYNKKLKEMAGQLGIKANLTSYVARHTWASLAKKMEFSVEIISEGLGHKDIKTTQIYLDNFDNKVLDDANDRIVG